MIICERSAWRQQYSVSMEDAGVVICNKKEVDTEAENNVNSDLIMKHAIEVNVEPEKFVVIQKTMNKDG